MAYAVVTLIRNDKRGVIVHVFECFETLHKCANLARVAYAEISLRKCVKTLY